MRTIKGFPGTGKWSFTATDPKRPPAPGRRCNYMKKELPVSVPWREDWMGGEKKDTRRKGSKRNLTSGSEVSGVKGRQGWEKGADTKRRRAGVPPYAPNHSPAIISCNADSRFLRGEPQLSPQGSWLVFLRKEICRKDLVRALPRRRKWG